MENIDAYAKPQTLQSKFWVTSRLKTYKKAIQIILLCSQGEEPLIYKTGNGRKLKMEREDSCEL